MGKAKTVEDIDALLSKHLDVLDADTVTANELRVADGISNMVGKWLKNNAIKLQYYDHIRKGGPVIKALVGGTQ